MARTYRKRITLIAAAALLFSALSPALASVLFAHRADILARVLGVSAHPVAAHAAATHDEGCPHEAAAAAQHHGAASSQPDDMSDHTAHGIFCSFCLASASTLTLPGVTLAATALVATVDDPPPAARSQPVVARFPSTHRSRAPPAVS